MPGAAAPPLAAKHSSPTLSSSSSTTHTHTPHTHTGAPHALVADHDGSPYSRWELGGVATLNELLLSRYAAAAAAAAAAAPADPAGHEGGREGSPGRGKDQDEQGGQSGGLVEFHPADRRRRRRQQRQRQQQQRPQPSGAALGFDAEAVAARDAAHYSARVRELLAYLGRRRPWLVHDPRMAWLAPLWCAAPFLALAIPSLLLSRLLPLDAALYFAALLTPPRQHHSKKMI